jgi:hypothetical protein
MAREIVKRCDVCKKPTDHIAAKLLYIPLTPNGSTRQRAHSNYSHHADVGVCCAKKLLGVFSFQERTSFDEYQQRRRQAG